MENSNLFISLYTYYLYIWSFFLDFLFMETCCLTIFILIFFLSESHTSHFFYCVHSFIVFFYCVYMLDKVSRLMFDIIYSGFPGDTAVKNPSPNKGDLEAQFDPWVTKIPWRGKWQPTLIFLPGESYKQRVVVDYSPWGCKESDRSQWLSMHACKDRELKMWLT